VPLSVDIEDAKRHLALLVKRSEKGEEIILTRRGHPVAQIVAIVP
jgi:prevent-host-death family protein